MSASAKKSGSVSSSGKGREQHLEGKSSFTTVAHQILNSSETKKAGPPYEDCNGRNPSTHSSNQSTKMRTGSLFRGQFVLVDGNNPLQGGARPSALSEAAPFQPGSKHQGNASIGQLTAGITICKHGDSSSLLPASMLQHMAKISNNLERTTKMTSATKQ